MDCPLLVWMLSLNRDTTQDVSHVVVLTSITLKLLVFRSTISAITWSGSAPPIQIYHTSLPMLIHSVSSTPDLVTN